MSKTILAQIDGFTPLPDLLVKRYGLFTAAVFGRMWRYCQMQDGVCRATLDTIATELNVSKMTIIRHVETLVYDGFLKDTTPDRRNKPHVYADTGKVAMYNKFGMALTITESESDKSTLTLSDSALTLSDSQSHLELLEDSNKKQIKKQKIKEGASATPETPKAKVKKEPTPQPPEISIFREVVKHFPKPFQRDTVIEAVQKVSARLGREVTVEDLCPYFKAWGEVSGNDWSLKWLTEWAVIGEITNGKSKSKPVAPSPVIDPVELAARRRQADALFGARQ